MINLFFNNTDPTKYTFIRVSTDTNMWKGFHTTKDVYKLTAYYLRKPAHNDGRS